MNITLSIHEDFTTEILELILKGKLEGGYSIDYALNSLVSFHEGKEIIVFDFNKFIKLDNRKCSYEIQNYGTIIVIKLI